MVKRLSSNKINLVVNPSLEHCWYSEVDDLLLPLKEFYSFGFGKAKVMDLRFLDLSSAVIGKSFLGGSFVSGPLQS